MKKKQPRIAPNLPPLGCEHCRNQGDVPLGWVLSRWNGTRLLSPCHCRKARDAAKAGVVDQAHDGKAQAAGV